MNDVEKGVETDVVRDKWVPIRVSLTPLIAITAVFLLPNIWWALVIKVLLVLLGLFFTSSAFQMGSKTGYPLLGVFAIWNIVLAIVLFAVDKALITYIVSFFFVVNWGFIYSKASH